MRALCPVPFDGCSVPVSRRERFRRVSAHSRPDHSRPARTGHPGTGYTLPPDRAEKAIAYARARRDLYFAEIFYEAIVLLLFLRWRLGPALRDWAERAGRNRFVQAVIFAPAFQLTFAVFTLPGSMAGHWLARSYGQSIQSWGSWFWDWTQEPGAGSCRRDLADLAALRRDAREPAPLVALGMARFASDHCASRSSWSLCWSSHCSSIFRRSLHLIPNWRLSSSAWSRMRGRTSPRAACTSWTRAASSIR